MSLDPAPTSILAATSTHRLVRCWRITRTDGTIFRFTECNRKINFDGDVYAPMGGMESSAIQREGQLSPGNLTAKGIISDDTIKTEDLRKGLFREAKVEEFLVDRTFTFAGYITKTVYWIVQTRFNGDFWEAEIEGVARWLAPDVGFLYTKNCRYQLGDSRCGVNISVLQKSTTVTSVAEVRRKFTATALIGDGANRYLYGYLTWTSGNNSGLISEVKTFDTDTGEVLLQLPLNADIQTSDGFTIRPGCDKYAATCQAAPFSNWAKFGGFPYIPGDKEVLKSIEFRKG